MKSADFSSLGKLTDGALLAELHRVTRAHRGLTAELVAHLAEMEARKLHLREACSSLFAYCTERLGFSEDEACRRIEAARLARRFPCIYDRLDNGRVSLSVLGRLKSVLTEENAQELLDAVSGKSVRDAERVLAARFPKPDVADSIRKLPARPAVPTPHALTVETNAPPELTQAPAPAVPRCSGCSGCSVRETRSTAPRRSRPSRAAVRAACSGEIHRVSNPRGETQARAGSHESQESQRRPGDHRRSCGGSPDCRADETEVRSDRARSQTAGRQTIAGHQCDQARSGPARRTPMRVRRCPRSALLGARVSGARSRAGQGSGWQLRGGERSRPVSRPQSGRSRAGVRAEVHGALSEEAGLHRSRWGTSDVRSTKTGSDELRRGFRTFGMNRDELAGSRSGATSVRTAAGSPIRFPEAPQRKNSELPDFRSPLRPFGPSGVSKRVLRVSHFQGSSRSASRFP